jgi:hypothetical protein
MKSNIFSIKRNKEINLLPQVSVGIFWLWQISATYKVFSMLNFSSTTGVTYLQEHETSRSFITSQQDSDGGIFGPSFSTKLLHQLLISVMSPHSS